MTAGTRGDVAPYAGLGQALHAAGHQVTVTTHAIFDGLVTGAGLAFRPLPGDPLAAQRSPAGARLHRHGGGLRGAVEFLRLGRRFLDELGTGLLDAGADADVLLLATAAAPLGYSVAERRGIPSLGVFLQPAAPTGDFPPVVLGRRSWGRWGNRALGRAGGAVSARAYAEVSRRLRARLGLPSVDLPELNRRAERQRWRVLHGISPAVLPRPADWRPGLEMVGYWWPPAQPHVEPPADLVDFLAAGPAPVLVSFGSMAGLGATTARVVAQALRQAGVRGIVQAGWSDLRVDGDDLLTVGEVPHDWLLPRVAAVVHHAGAGTTAAGLRAGVPAVPVPVLADQPFWASRLARLGAGTRPVPVRLLTVDGSGTGRSGTGRSGAGRLAAAIRDAVHRPEIAANARRIATRIAAEDGTTAVRRALADLPP
ncbi:glycosyltransferase [Solwaraspora sp. WMMB335]|uniref:glycosyltransferase n=1 Tax=Solwaraspora sp. WMMB335 TaxID=3404118 RepID=UPI003B932F0F